MYLRDVWVTHADFSHLTNHLWTVVPYFWAVRWRFLVSIFVVTCLSREVCGNCESRKFDFHFALDAPVPNRCGVPVPDRCGRKAFRFACLASVDRKLSDIYREDVRTLVRV